jgi:hypothetical protein
MGMVSARLDLCKELCKLSGWKNTFAYWYQNWMLGNKWMVGYQGSPSIEATVPAYDLGYLLTKLPPQTSIKKEHDASPQLPEETPAHYRALYDTTDGRHFWLGADTPEDAACLLAIELFKQGVLKVNEREV